MTTTITTTKTVYNFDELPEELKKKVLEKNYDVNVAGVEWWDDYFDYFRDVGRVLGFDIDNIYFSGFSSQGDGACFTGRYRYAKGWAEELKKYTSDPEVMAIANSLQDLQKRHFYRLSCSISHRGHYNHSLCTSFDVYNNGDWAEEVICDDLEQIVREFMDWMYAGLSSGYDYLTSDDAITDTLIVNEYQFNEDGTIA